MRLKAASLNDAEVLAAIHAQAFEAPWTAEALAELLAAPGVFALAVWDGAEAVGFILMRVVADEAEVLTLAVGPEHRRRGIGRALVEAGLLQAGQAEAVFLEVAQDNTPAIGLYERAGFAPAGRRPAYYARKNGLAADALLLRKTLPRGGA